MSGEAEDIVERVAKAMYDTQYHAVPWEQAYPDHRAMWTTRARALLVEAIAVTQIQRVFGEVTFL